MDEERKQRIIEEIIKGFDFELVKSVMYLRDREYTIVKLQKIARRMLEKTLEHTDREFWYAGTGCLCAYYDDINGVGLCFIPERSRMSQSEIWK
jgi:hypothetical protein